MHRPGRRIHRLPQHLDYILIPAPSDVSLPSLSEKSPLPAIVVTPSSPSCSAEFSIAFLGPPPKPTLCERVLSYVEPVQELFSFRTRTIIMFILLMAVMIFHVLSHRFAALAPQLSFSNPEERGIASHVAKVSSMDWFSFRWSLSPALLDGKRDFVINESG